MWSTLYRYTVRISRGSAGEKEVYGSDSLPRAEKTMDREKDNRRGLGPVKIRLYEVDELMMEILVS